MRAFVIDLVQIWILASSGRKSGHFKETKLLLSFITFNTYNIKQNAHIKTLEQECRFPCLITFTACFRHSYYSWRTVWAPPWCRSPWPWRSSWRGPRQGPRSEPPRSPSSQSGQVNQSKVFIKLTNQRLLIMIDDIEFIELTNMRPVFTTLSYQGPVSNHDIDQSGPSIQDIYQSEA